MDIEEYFCQGSITVYVSLKFEVKMPKKIS